MTVLFSSPVASATFSSNCAPSCVSLSTSSLSSSSLELAWKHNSGGSTASSARVSVTARQICWMATCLASCPSRELSLSSRKMMRREKPRPKD
eukprot:scaffold4410_cov32-Tisochrysis_lutea.AAC.1